MRCRDVDELWDDVRGECQKSLKEAVDTHLFGCTYCQELYKEYEGVAYCLSSLPAPEPSCNLAKKVVEHIALIKRSERTTPLVLTSVQTPIGRLYVGFKEEKIAFVGIDTGVSAQEVCARVERRLRRKVEMGDAPAWLKRTLEHYFSTWQVEDGVVDIEDLTPFEQAALRAAAQIPPGEVRSYSWVATQIGRPRAARAVGQVMARNPLPLLFPCHRVVDASGELHNYGYGLEMKARLLKMEGYSARKL